MSSSISSFRNELKVIALVAVLIGAMNLREGMLYSHRQYEYARLRTFPVIADHLATEQGTRMILLGNSLTEVGYNMPQLNAQLQHDGHGDLHVENISQTGSAPTEWYHNFARIFVRRGKSPDVIVIDMSPSGIADGPPAGYRIGWLAHETDWRDVPEVMRKDLPDIDTDGQYLLARVCPLYADRWDLRIDVICHFIPNFQAGMKWVNDTPVPLGKNTKVVAPPANTYSVLTRMLELARLARTHVILVAMPARERYEIDPNLSDILNQYRVRFVDCRDLAGLTPDCFEDGWHLNPRGATYFTDHMARVVPAESEAFQPPATASH